MNTIALTRRSALAAALMLSLAAAQAQRPHWRHAPAPRVVVVAPAAKSVNQITRDDRLSMAIAYLKGNRYLSAKRYAKMTGLTKAAAEAELDAFAAERKGGMAKVKVGKKSMYTLV